MIYLVLLLFFANLYVFAYMNKRDTRRNETRSQHRGERHEQLMKLLLSFKKRHN